MENKGTWTLETDRLILRQFRIDDAEKMFKNWASDPAYYNWVIELKEINEIIGNISVVKLNGSTEAADIGYCMGKAWWGKAIMPEALGVVIKYLFEEVGLNRVVACHDSNNPKLGRVMDKAGMKLEGILRAVGINNQGIGDKVWHSILKKEYEK